MWRHRASLLLLGSALLLVLTAFRSAKMEVPAALASSAEALSVSGHNPRTWNHPIAFGPYRTSSVHEGWELSWSVEVFGIRGGRAKRPYRLVLEGPDGSAWEVECLTKSIEAWRSGWSVDLTAVFTPRLVCGLYSRRDEKAFRLILSSAGNELRHL